jgi:uncharacterized circularly permuted ATP-grasp superfamily protein
MLAVDLARSPDGQWWVLSDRTQAPSGSGYALENRTIVSDVLPDLFRKSNVLRLAPFFRAQREALTSLAPAQQSAHRIAYSRSAQRDLLRTLLYRAIPGIHSGRGSGPDGARPVASISRPSTDWSKVDVILRRVDDSFCDPLELRSDSLLGVPGLVDAIVAGNVKVANALGSGLIETAAIMPFLPGLSSIAGREAEASVRRDLVVRAALRARLGARPSRFGGGEAGVSLARHGAGIRGRTRSSRKGQVCRAIADSPARVCGAGAGRFVHAPVWDNGHLLIRAASCCALTCSTPAMDGLRFREGLVRVAEAEGSVVSMQRGGHSKDAWVLWDSPVDTFSMLRPRNEPVELRRESPVCQAASPTMFSGWADMSSAPKTLLGSCAP